MQVKATEVMSSTMLETCRGMVACLLVGALLSAGLPAPVRAQDLSMQPGQAESPRVAAQRTGVNPDARTLRKYLQPGPLAASPVFYQQPPAVAAPQPSKKGARSKTQGLALALVGLALIGTGGYLTVTALTAEEEIAIPGMCFPYWHPGTGQWRQECGPTRVEKLAAPHSGQAYAGLGLGTAGAMMVLVGFRKMR